MQDVCYSDILCQYWQYASDGCRVEDPTFGDVQYPLTLEGGASTNTEYARNVRAGEFIQHYCRARTEQQHSGTLRKERPDPLGQFAAWRLLPYGILLTLVILTLSCLAFCIFDSQMDDAGGLEEMPKTEHPADLPDSHVEWRRSRNSAAAATAQAPLATQLASLPQRFFSPPSHQLYGANRAPMTTLQLAGSHQQRRAA